MVEFFEKMDDDKLQEFILKRETKEEFIEIISKFNISEIRNILITQFSQLIPENSFVE